MCFALTPQLAEQIDYIRVMPPRTAANRRSWWVAFLFSGPGWVLFSGTKQVIGVFLAVYLVMKVDPSIGASAAEPVRQFLGIYQSLLPDWIALGLALILIVVAQVKDQRHERVLGLARLVERLHARPESATPAARSSCSSTSPSPSRSCSWTSSASSRSS